MKTNEKRIGWSTDVTKGRERTHFFVDEISLCGRADASFRNRKFVIRDGSKYFMDCVECVKRYDAGKPFD